ncbi:hypothetical protein Forpi1262_v007153 [Fusarium oxysporum f. sp. raphani]|uniref:Uncharacterized protein n=1 Tax=Fusarium oxysporum f. sp. raphani TaxID=96318 RepID=A0A8J5U7Z5_FUSOX|nr:hypothetical protein Forpi1262_v007153 [Fusarium oxysporum f. sp. raphani]
MLSIEQLPSTKRSFYIFSCESVDNENQEAEATRLSVAFEPVRCRDYGASTQQEQISFKFSWNLKPDIAISFFTQPDALILTNSDEPFLHSLIYEWNEEDEAGKAMSAAVGI